MIANDYRCLQLWGTGLRAGNKYAPREVSFFAQRISIRRLSFLEKRLLGGFVAWLYFLSFC